jgi:hypothetical protein
MGKRGGVAAVPASVRRCALTLSKGRDRSGGAVGKGL